MKLKLAIAATLLAVAPAFAQAPAPQKAPKPTEAQVQKVVQTIIADKTKMDAYCKLAKIQQQMGTLGLEKDAKKLEALGQQADAEAQKLGAEFENMMDGLEEVQETSAEGKKLATILASLDSKCPK